MAKKRGELTTQQIVTLIILIVSVAVILFLIFRLNPGATSNKEICHNSVMLKARGKGLVSELDCRTSYVCISGGGECEGFSSTEKININAENKGELLKAIADKMAECWWMFGKGQVDYQGTWDNAAQTIKFWEDFHCAICSEIKFDEIMKEDKITYEELYEFLSGTEYGKESYLEYLYGESDVAGVFELSKKISPSDEISFSGKYIIATGMKKGEHMAPYFVKSSEVASKTECEFFDISKS